MELGYRRLRANSHLVQDLGSHSHIGRMKPSNSRIGNRDTALSRKPFASAERSRREIGIGGRSPVLPPTPPYMRVRIRRFGGLSYV